MPAAPASRPTLRKVGADLRWLLEKSGVNPENTFISIGVVNESDKSLLISTFLREFDPDAMTRDDARAHMIEIHGVRITIVTNPELAKLVGRHIT